jgi:hypothetical protein
MKKLSFYLFAVSLFFTATACQHLSFNRLTSTTSIKAKEAFLLGNNKHGKFYARLKNISNTEITVWQCPIDGGRHSPTVVKPNETIKVNVDRNTALKIENQSDTQVEIELLVKGDTGLSMGYRN